MIYSLLAFVLSVAPVRADGFYSAIDSGVQWARAAAESSEDTTLSVLYQRLFVLQDSREREAALADTAEMAIGDLVLEYRKFRGEEDMTAALLKEIATNPEHPNYPQASNTAKLKILMEVREKARAQILGALRMNRIARDIKEVEALITANLERRRSAPTRS
jgi:hypothetical protein